LEQQVCLADSSLKYLTNSLSRRLTHMQYIRRLCPGLRYTHRLERRKLLLLINSMKLQYHPSQCW